MQPNDIRIAMFGLMGFTDPIEPGIGNAWYRRNPATGETKRIPEYLTDLNAVAALIPHLSPMRQLRYRRALWHVYHRGLPVEITRLSAPVDASAAQRCEAILRACDLWPKDSS